MSDLKNFNLSKEHALIMMDMDDPNNLHSSSLKNEGKPLNKRSFEEYELSIVNMSNKDKKQRRKNQLAILSNKNKSEGRFSTTKSTKSYAIMVYDESKNQVEIVKVPFWFAMKNVASEEELEKNSSNKILQLEDMDQRKRKEMMIKEIGTIKSRKMLDKLKNKSIEVCP
jgi:hypothetical protein